MDPKELEEILKALRGELGEFGKTLLEDREKMVARLDEIDGRINDLPSSGSDGQLKHRWGNPVAAIAAGNPLAANPEGTAEEAVEELRERVSKERSGHFVMMPNGTFVPVLKRFSAIRGSQVPAQQRNALMAVRQMRALALAVSQGREPSAESALAAARGWGDPELLGALEHARDMVRGLRSGDREQREASERALGTATLGSGASFVPGEYFGEVIDYLHDMSVVRSSGPSILPMSRGSLTIPFVDSAAQATYVGENAGSNATTLGDAVLKLVRKKLQIIFPLSNELLAEASYAVDAFVLRHMGYVAAAREDLAFIRGDKTEHTPGGMKYWAEQSSAGGDAHNFNRTLDTGAPTVQTITNDLIKALRILEDSKVPLMMVTWFMSPRDFWGLVAKRGTSTDTEVFAEMRGGTLYGQPVKRSTQIPKTLAGDASGTGTGNKSEVYCAAMGNNVIAESDGAEITAQNGVAYKNASGVVTAGFTEDQTVMKMNRYHDFGDLYRGASNVLIESVDWGATA